MATSPAGSVDVTGLRPKRWLLLKHWLCFFEENLTKSWSRKGGKGGMS
jgi:hypothetical protein